MSKENRFTWSGRIKSFGHAIRGLLSVFTTEYNMRFHLIASLAVAGLCIWLPVTTGEIAVLVIAMGLVWIAEIFNTVLEKAMDVISPNYDERIKRIKDMSAAAVLVSAITALVAGCFIIIPKMLS